MKLSASFRILFFLILSAACAEEYDALVIGSSPFSMLEAIYQHSLGKKVLIAEASGQCGGAWQSIDICGIKEVDLGCHQIGSNPAVISFLSEKLGCRMVPMDDPFEEKSPPPLHPNGYYFSKGCYEFVAKILEKIKLRGIEIRLHSPVDRVWIQSEKKILFYLDEKPHLAKKTDLHLP